MLREEKISRPRFFLFFLTGLLLTVLLAAAPDRRPLRPHPRRRPGRETSFFTPPHTSPQSTLIRPLARSPYTHCGIVVRHKGRWLVLEAVQSVKLTPLAAWTARGAGLTLCKQRQFRDINPGLLRLTFKRRSRSCRSA